MHLIAFATTHEGLENYLAAIRLAEARGGKVEIAWVTRAGGRSPPLLDGCGLTSRLLSLPAENAESAAGRAMLAGYACEIVADDPDIFFLCDAQAPLSGAMAALLRESGYRGLIVGGQGGLAMSGAKDLGADRLLCFGERPVERLPARHRRSAYAVGLPRLDRLRDLPVTSEPYSVFLAHRSPEGPVIDATLSAFEKQSRLPVVVCGHPDYPGLYRHRPTLSLPGAFSRAPGRTTLEAIQHCRLVLATDATGVLDALYLGKTVVLLPNAGLAAFDRYPGVSEGFAPSAIAQAARRCAEEPGRVAEFLQETVGGIDRRHAESVLAAWSRLLSSGPLRKASRTTRTAVVASNPESPLPRITTRVELARFIPAGGTAAELGVAKGAFSDELLSAGGDFRLYSVDRWAGDRGHDNEEYSAACALLGRHGARSVVVRKSFDAALHDFAPGSLDLVYIDGYAHDGQDGCRTLEDWWTRVRPGGVLAGHDYHPDWKLTMEAVDNFCGKHGLRVQTTDGDFFPSWYVTKAGGKAKSNGESFARVSSPAEPVHERCEQMAS
jgi:Methyltransferase domain